jgi:hypothetical protein
MTLVVLKAKIVTVGTVIAICLMTYIAIGGAVHSGLYSYFGIFLFVVILTNLGIIKGYRLAYISARFLYRAVAMPIFFISINLFIRAEVSDDSYQFWIFAETVSIGILCMALSWCLGLHAKSRGVKGYNIVWP